MVPKRIVLPLYLDCDSCGKHIEIDVPYVYNSTEKDENGCMHDIYIKQRLDNIDNLCNCNGIYKKFEEEYDKMNPSYDMIH